MRQNGRSVSSMSNEERSTWAKEHMTKACIELLMEKPIEKITVSELCKRSGAGRATFYRNYKDMTDIVRKYLIRLNHEWTEAPLVLQSGMRNLADAIFSHFERHRKFYELLNKRGLVYLMKDVITDTFGLKTDGPMIEAYSSAYVIYILYGFIEVWFQRGMKDPATELCALLPDAPKDSVS